MQNYCRHLTAELRSFQEDPGDISWPSPMSTQQFLLLHFIGEYIQVWKDEVCKEWGNLPRVTGAGITVRPPGSEAQVHMSPVEAIFVMKMFKTPHICACEYLYVKRKLEKYFC